MADTTLQTPAPLKRQALSSGNRSIGWIRMLVNSPADVDLEPPYQRGDVWGIRRRRNLIRSLMLSVPIPSIVVNNRMEAKFAEPGYDSNRNTATAVIDGKQRVTTIMMFFADQLDVPASWFDPDYIVHTHETVDGPYVYYSGLSRRSQLRFENCPVAVSEGVYATLEAEAELFDLVNFGGIPQGESDDDIVATRATHV